MQQADSDARLVRRCLEGEKPAFSILVERYQKVLFNVALRIVRDPDDAADITQSVLVKAYEKLDRYDPAYKFYSWIYRMTVNASLNFAKRHRRKRSLEGREILARTTPDDDLDAREASEQVDRAMFKLAPEERALLSLKYMADLSYRDLAFVFDTPERTIKSRLYTARQRLKECLVALGFDEPDRA